MRPVLRLSGAATRCVGAESTAAEERGVFERGGELRQAHPLVGLGVQQALAAGEPAKGRRVRAGRERGLVVLAAGGCTWYTETCGTALLSSNFSTARACARFGEMLSERPRRRQLFLGAGCNEEDWSDASMCMRVSYHWVPRA